MFSHFLRTVAFCCAVLFLMSCSVRPITESRCMGYYDELFEYMYDEDFDRADILQCEFKQCSLRLFLLEHDVVEILKRYKEQTGEEISIFDFIKLLKEWELCPLS
jgi:hypothetical protein